MEELTVIKTEDNFYHDYIIVKDSEIQEIKYCETFDKYGQKIRCELAGCDEDNHTTCKAITYHDSRNWKTFIVEHNDCGLIDGVIVEGKKADQILKAHEKFKRNYVEGVAKEEIKGFLFFSSLFANDFALANIKVL